MLIEDEEYLAVYFSGPCDDPDDDCAKILEDLESVDSTMQVCAFSMPILMVKGLKKEIMICSKILNYRIS